MLRLIQALSASFIVAFAIAATVPAADNNGKGPAYTEPPAGDPNFSLMGEFVGVINAGKPDAKLLGLQIRAIGNDEFDAVSFLGGLPGQEAHSPEAVRMIGRRSDNFVILSGGPFAIIVEADACLLLNREGNKVGRLERIHRKSPTLGAPPPKDAVVLFDGSNIDQFTNAQMTEDGLLMEGADLKPMFQDFNLHVEFRIPYMPQADGQSRGNSGLYLQSRYECQVLDSFALEPLVNGLGSLYRFKAPELNMAFPPLVWQTYDVQFTAPRWASDGSKLRNAHVTSWINGVKVQDNVALPSKTGAGKQEEPNLLPTKFQNHGDPVRFRNIWLIDRGISSGEFPVYPSEEQAEAKPKAEKENKAKKTEKAVEKTKADTDAKSKPAADVKPKGEQEKPADKEKPAEKESAEKKTDQDSPKTPTK